MGFLRRVFGRSGRVDEVDIPPAAPIDDGLEPATEPAETESVEIQAPVRATCPSCGYPLDPPPTRDRRCPSCRQPILVRRTEGRLVFLTEEAVVVFDRERGRIADEMRWTAERDEWLALASGVDAPPARVAHLAEAELTSEVVDAARELYVTAADRAVRTARGAKDWNDVSRIRRQQAAAFFHASGNPVPPPDEIAGLHREAMLAVLRAFAVAYKDVELVGAGCCKPCRVGDGKAFKIADELRVPRLPHDGCPKGLCACEWWLAMPGPKSRRRRKATPASPPGPATEPPTDGVVPDGR